MSITKEEAYNLMNEELNKWIKWNPEPDSPYWKMMQAIQMALKALRPVSREQVAKVWRGYWIKHDGYTECSKCEYWYPSTEDEDEDDRNPFCPACGAPMTNEAVDIIMRRLEALKDGGT